MKTKTGLLILFLLLLGIAVTAILSIRLEPTPEDQRAERIILSYLVEKGIHARPGTRAYSQFMKGILLGEYPELTDLSFGYLENSKDVDFILDFAVRNMDVPYNALDGTEIPEALAPSP